MKTKECAQGIKRALRGDAMSGIGYLQHGRGKGPFRTESVPVKLSGWRPNGQCWLAFFESRWRVVHVQVKRTFIVYNGERITINIEGV